MLIRTMTVFTRVLSKIVYVQRKLIKEQHKILCGTKLLQAFEISACLKEQLSCHM